MTTKRKVSRAVPQRHTGEKPWEAKVRKATAMAEEALRHYGEPTMSLEELQNLPHPKLGKKLLSKLIIKDRD